jgi:hypothetical protein
MRGLGGALLHPAAKPLLWLFCMLPMLWLLFPTSHNPGQLHRTSPMMEWYQSCLLPCSNLDEQRSMVLLQLQRQHSQTT